ncbi:MAG: apolipoprotein N-acyltransferase [Spirochaetota bacterium]
MLSRTVLLTLASGLLFPLALPNELFPLGAPLLGVVALAPYYLALRATDRAKSAARLGALFGAVSTIIANYWLMFFGDYSVWTIGGTTIGYIAYNYVLAGFLWKTTRAPAAYRPVLFAMAWALYEYAKSIGFLAYPWGLAAYPFSDLIVVNQIVDVTGVWALSFLAVYITATLAELVAGGAAGLSTRRAWFAPPTLRNAGMAAVLVAIVAGYGAVRLQSEVPVRDTLDLVLVQQNADAWNTSNIARPLRTAQEETERGLADLEHDPELVVWSETSLRYFYEEDRDEDRDWYAANPPERPFLDFVSDLPAPLLTGSPLRDPDDEFAVYNAVLLIDGDTTVRQWYGKQHLVPFAEVIPFWDTPLVRDFFSSVIGIPGIWAPGPGSRLFRVTGNEGREVAIATPICFEDGFAYVNRRFVLAGADVILNLTNNAWSRTDSAQLQHFVAARYRAIETRRGLVRSTNSGYTSVVDPWGRVTDSLPMFETAHLSVRVPVYEPDSEPIYMRWGDYLPQLFLLVLAALFAFEQRPKRARE